MANVFSKNNALKHYEWASGCDGWNYVDNDALSVKQESMVPGTSEKLHYHEKAQQFFYLLKGVATFELEGIHYTVKAGEGIHIAPGIKHRVLNNGSEAIEFILSSQPSTANDRINCE